MKKKLILLSSFVLGATPFLALAQGVTGGTGSTGGTATNCAAVVPGSIEFIVCKASQLVNTVVPFLIALGVVFFVWGVVSYMIAGDEEAKTKGRDKIIYGLIGLAVIIAMWGLVKILTNTFGVSTNPTNITLPTTPY